MGSQVPDRVPIITRSWRSLHRLRTLLLLWLMQAGVVWLVLTAWMVLCWGRGGSIEHPIWPWLCQTAEQVVSSSELWMCWGIGVGAVTVLQGLLLLPVRRPNATGNRGWPLLVSMAVAALAAVGLLLVLLCGVVTILQLREVKEPVIEDLLGKGILPCMLVCWAVATPLMFGFATRRLAAGERHEQVLTRIASRLFMGTIIEAVALVPLDVMARRKIDCYCSVGTFWGLTLCMSIGLLAFGPAVFLPILARRRKRWYAGRCDCCGYDMTGHIESDRVIDRCPECGAGWKPEKTGPES